MGHNPSGNDHYADLYRKARYDGWNLNLILIPSQFQRIETDGKIVSLCPTCPVDGVSWDDANRFINRLNQIHARSGYAYRIPTEAEFEYAIRGGTESKFIVDEAHLDEYVQHGKPHYVAEPIKLRRANPFGIYRSGVWEWVSDWYGEFPWEIIAKFKQFHSHTINDSALLNLIPMINPEGPSAPTGQRTLRGGSANDEKTEQSSYARGFSAPNLSRFDDKRRIGFGFRLIRTKNPAPIEL